MNTYYDSYDNYKKFLDDQIEIASHNFQEAKEKAIRELQAMTVWTASEYGAGYASQIEKITKYAAELQQLGYQYRVFNNMFEEAIKNDKIRRNDDG